MKTNNTRPNLLYIHSDQHNPNVLGCYGDPIVQTPNLDGLAKRGIILENIYCPSPICVPSRMSMLSGRFPFENEVWANNHILHSGIPTFAHAMGARGYRPALIGRMHALGPDQLHGYTERLVGDHGPNHPGGKGVDHGILSGTAGPSRVSLKKSGAGQSAYQVHDEDVTAATVDYLNRLGVKKRAKLSIEPFCLSVGFMLPHQPFVARRIDYDLYRKSMTLPLHPDPTSSPHPYFNWWRKKCGIEKTSNEEILRSRTAYWALVTRLDSMIGEVLDALKKNNLDRNTLIIYMSDHGEQVGEHGLWWKQTFYEDSVKIPAILSWPGNLPEDIRIEQVISSIDLNATMLDALEAPPLPASHGRSLLKLLQYGDSCWENIAFSEYCTNDGCFHRMVRSGPWKLNYYAGQESQLFNLEEDPQEMTNRIQDARCRDIQETLTAKILDGWDSAEIAKKIAEKRADYEILTAWGQKTQPKDNVRWNLHPKMSYLD